MDAVEKVAVEAIHRRGVRALPWLWDRLTEALRAADRRGATCEDLADEADFVLDMELGDV